MANRTGSPGDTAYVNLCISSHQRAAALSVFCHMWRTSKGPKGSLQETLSSRALVHVDFSEQSLWVLIIHAGGISCPRGQLFWNTVLFSHLAPRNDLCENSRKHQSTVSERYSISTETQSSHKHLPHNSLCWQPASAHVCNFWSNSPHPLLRPCLNRGHLSDPAFKWWND